MKTKTKNKKDLFFDKYDLYSDANPKDTIRIKYKTLEDVMDTIKKLERLYKTNKYKHARISQVANVMTQRLRVINTNDKTISLSGYPAGMYNMIIRYDKMRWIKRVIKQ